MTPSAIADVEKALASLDGQYFSLALQVLYRFIEAQLAKEKALLVVPEGAD